MPLVPAPGMAESGDLSSLDIGRGSVYRRGFPTMAGSIPVCGSSIDSVFQANRFAAFWYSWSHGRGGSAKPNRYLAAAATIQLVKNHLKWISLPTSAFYRPLAGRDGLNSRGVKVSISG